jgi:hypothetical protein
VKNTLAPSLAMWFATFIKVKPVVGDLTINAGSCNLLSLPRTTVKNADLVIFSLGQPSGQPSVIAYAAACRQDAKGRAVAGIINWCPKFLKETATDPAKIDYWQSVMVSRHELLHVLAFSPNLYDLFINPTTEQRLGSANVVAKPTVNGKTLTVIKTVPVRARGLFCFVLFLFLFFIVLNRLSNDSRKSLPRHESISVAQR